MKVQTAMLILAIGSTIITLMSVSAAPGTGLIIKGNYENVFWAEDVSNYTHNLILVFNFTEVDIAAYGGAGIAGWNLKGGNITYENPEATEYYRTVSNDFGLKRLVLKVNKPSVLAIVANTKSWYYDDFAINLVTWIGIVSAIVMVLSWIAVIALSSRH